MFLLKDKRQELVDLIRKLTKEEIKLGEHWDQWADEEVYLSGVEKEILHILLHFVRDKRIIFKEDKSSEDAERLIILLEEFKKDIEEIKEDYASLEDHHKEHVDEVHRRLELLLSAIHKDDQEMTDLIEKEFGITEGPEFTLEDRTFHVEYHPKIRTMQEVDGEMVMSEDDSPYLLVFDNNYLVAAIQGELDDKKFTVQSTHETYLKFKGYISHAISLLLTEKKIEVWESGPVDDPELERIYEDTKGFEHLRITRKDDGFIIKMIQRL